MTTTNMNMFVPDMLPVSQLPYRPNPNSRAAANLTDSTNMRVPALEKAPTILTMFVLEAVIETAIGLGESRSLALFTAVHPPPS